MMTLPASLVRKSIFFCRWTFKVHIIYDFVLINFSKKNIDLGRQIFCPKWNPHEKISWHFYFTSTHLLHFRLLCPCSNSEVRNVRPNRSSICIRSVNTGEKDLIESIYNVLGIGKLWLETCFFFLVKKILTMFSTSWGRWRLTVFTAWNTSISPCWMTCSIQALAAQYTPALDWPSLKIVNKQLTKM